MYQVIIVSGNDAEEFLQGQLTQDIAGLGELECLPAAWCNAQGRVIVTMTIAAIGDRYALIVPANLATTVLSRLGMYRLRAKVEFALAESGWQVFAATLTAGQADVLPEGIGYTSLAASGPVTEILAPPGALADVPPGAIAVLAEAEWKTARILAGRVDIDAGNSALYTPHMLNLDLTGAVSFSKGCYIGQEIVARTEHRGRSKRRTFRYRCPLNDMKAGDVLRDDSNDVGVIVNATGNDLLAVVAVDAAGRSLEIRGAMAIPEPLPYSAI